MKEETQTKTVAFSDAEMEVCLEVLQRISEDPTMVDDHKRFKGLVAKIHRLGKRGQRDRKREILRSANRAAVESTGIVQQQNGVQQQKIAPVKISHYTVHLHDVHVHVYKGTYSLHL